MEFSRRNIVPLLLAIIFREMSLTDATIYANNDKNETSVFDDMEANFGPGLNQGIWGVLLSAEPSDGCKPIKPPPFAPNVQSNITIFSFVLLARGGCDFALKVFNAQTAGYHAAIVHNIGSNELVEMNSGLPSTARKIYIPSVFVGEDSGIELNKTFLYNRGDSPYIQLYEGNRNPLDFYLIPFVIVIAVCLTSLICFLLIKWMCNRRRARRGRLSLQRLKKLPVKKFDKGDEYDVCAICLEDYEEGDSLRILPCDHAYHCKCVDPWLTSSKRVCPLCKRRVLSDDESNDSSDDSDDSTDDERTPLTPSSVAASPNAPMYATGYGTRNPFLSRRLANRTVSISSDDTTSTDASDFEHEAGPQHRPSPHRNTVTVSLTNEIPQTSGYQSQQLTSVNDIEQEILNPMISQPTHPDAYLYSAEAMMAGPSRASESSIAVLSDVESSISTSEAHSCSSQDFHSLDESMTVAARTPIDLDSSISAVADEDQDDIVVIAQGSKTRVQGSENEI